MANWNATEQTTSEKKKQQNKKLHQNAWNNTF